MSESNCTTTDLSQVESTLLSLTDIMRMIVSMLGSLHNLASQEAEPLVVAYAHKSLTQKSANIRTTDDSLTPQPRFCR